MQASNKQLTLGAIGSVLVLLVLWYVFTGIGARNQEATLRSQFNAVMKGNEVDYDAMWKIINQTAQVPHQYTKDFKDAYTSIVSAGSGSSVDQNAVKGLFAVATGMRPPQLDSSLYRKIQDVIEAQRTKFANAQRQALAIKSEHDTLRTTWPSSMFVGNAKELEVKIVTSTQTDQAFSTGKDDNVNLFGDAK